MTGYQYFNGWWEQGDYEQDRPDGTPKDFDWYYWHAFSHVARAAIDAAENGYNQAACELKNQAHYLLSQSERNEGGRMRQLELHMNREFYRLGIECGNP